MCFVSLRVSDWGARAFPETEGKRRVSSDAQNLEEFHILFSSCELEMVVLTSVVSNIFKPSHISCPAGKCISSQICK